MKKAIITGANGFIGRHLVREYVNNGYFVFAIVKDEREDTSLLTTLQNVVIIYCELSEMKTLANKVEDREIDVFYHLAWAGVSGTGRNDYELQLANIDYSCRAVEAASSMGCKRFVYVSTLIESENYRAINKTVKPESITYYCAAKAAANAFCKTLANQYGLEYVKAVLANTYSEKDTSDRFLYTSIRKMLLREKVSFTNAEQMYDFIYLSDAVTGLFRIGESGVINKSYFVGSLAPKPLKEYLFVVRDCIDRRIELGLGDLESSNVIIDYYEEYDIYAIKEDTGFVPKVSFEDGIERLIYEYKNNKL